MVKKLIKNVIASSVNQLIYYMIPAGKEDLPSPEKAETILENHSPDPKPAVICNRVQRMQDVDLTIIIPVYNVEKYLEQCMDSVIKQKTTYRYHVVVVDDGSTDSCEAILKRYAHFENITIIRQENTGISGARNRGLRCSCGRYVMFLDSDDYLLENAVQSLMDTAYRVNADIVQGGYYDIDGDTGNCLGKTVYVDSHAVPPNGILAGMAWGKVFSAKLFDCVCFPEKCWFEDTIITGIITHLAKTIATVSDMVYCYRKNRFGITRTSIGKPKSIDTFWVHRCVLSGRKKLGIKTDKAFYEHLLRMVVLCYQRTENEPEDVKISMFVLWRDMLQNERKESFCVGKRYHNLEKAIFEGNYKRYCLVCKAY